MFDGNTADPMTLAAQIEKLKQRFQLDHVILVGDRGMITQARITEESDQPASLITVLPHRATRAGRKRRVATLVVRSARHGEHHRT